MDFDKPDNLEASRSKWEEDIDFKDALREVNAAKARVDMKRKMADFAKVCEWRRQEDRWRAMYDFLYKYNLDAKLALDDFNADCDRMRQEQKSWNATGKHLKHGLHFPKILWDALEIMDEEIKNYNELDRDAQRKVMYKLGRTFPRYWMPRV